MIDNDEIERIAADLDRAGFLVTRRGETEAAAVAQLLNVDLRTLRRWREFGRGPAHTRTIGTTALYSLEDILELRKGAAP